MDTRGPSIKLKADFQLRGGFSTLTPAFSWVNCIPDFSEKSIYSEVFFFFFKPINIDGFKIKSKFRKREHYNIVHPVRC